MQLAVLLAVTTPAFLGASGCKSDKGQPSDTAPQLLDDALMEVSPALAIMSELIDSRMEIHCRLDELLRHLADDGGNTNPSGEDAPLMRAITESNRAPCQLFRRVKTATTPLLDRIRTTKVTPRETYVFSVFLPNDDDNFQKEELGPFATMSLCARMESLARTLDIPTQTCRPWRATAPLPAG